MQHWKLIVENKEGDTKLSDIIFIIEVDKLEKDLTDFLLQCNGKSWNNDVARYREEAYESELNQELRLSIRWCRTGILSEKLLPYLIKGELPDTKIDKILIYSY